MTVSRQPAPPSAALVEPRSIELQAACGGGAQLLVRRRPPGAVCLDSGQREHMLMCSVGRSAPGAPTQSVLRTEDGVRQWRRPPSGQVTFIPAGMPLDWEWSYHSDSIHLILQPRFVEGLRDQVEEQTGTRAGLRPLLRSTNEPLRQVLRQLRDEAATPDLGQELALSSLANLAAVEVLRAMGAADAVSSRSTSGGLSEPELRRAVELIEDRLGERVSLEELALECGLSTFHFARAFKRSTGLPPHEYQLRRRVERAQVILRSGSRQSVAEIASELGFADESHLRRHFKRLVGTTPGRFRG